MCLICFRESVPYGQLAIMPLLLDLCKANCLHCNIVHIGLLIRYFYILQHCADLCKDQVSGEGCALASQTLEDVLADGVVFVLQRAAARLALRLFDAIKLKLVACPISQAIYFEGLIPYFFAHFYATVRISGSTINHVSICVINFPAKLDMIAVI